MKNTNMKKIFPAAMVVWGFLSSTAMAGITKPFVCCQPDYASCTGSGGTTLYIQRGGGQEVSKFHAQQRCHINKMFWDTNSCPVEGASCSSSGDYVPAYPYTMPVPHDAHEYKKVHVENLTGRTAYLALKTESDGHYRTFSWYKVDPRSHITLHYLPMNNSACLGINMGPEDAFYHRRVAGNGGQTGEVQSIWVHPIRNSSVNYTQRDGLISATVFTYQSESFVSPRESTREGMNLEQFKGEMNANELVPYQCWVANGWDSYFAIHPTN